MPERLVNGCLAVIAIFLVVTKWTPPVFHKLDQIGVPLEQPNAGRAKPGAIKYPEQLGLSRAKRIAGIHGDLIFHCIAKAFSVRPEC